MNLDKRKLLIYLYALLLFLIFCICLNDVCISLVKTNMTYLNGYYVM